MPTDVYNGDLIWSLREGTVPIHWPLRTILFTYSVWRPPSWPGGRNVTHGTHLISLRRPPLVLHPQHRSKGGFALPHVCNVGSLWDKYVAISDSIPHNNLDLLAVTESWHQSFLDVFHVLQSAPSGYASLDSPRLDSSGQACPGGGIVLFYKELLV